MLEKHTEKDRPERCYTSKVDFSLLLKSMRIVIWKVETWRMCLRVFDPVSKAPPTPTSEPSSCTERKSYNINI